MPENNSSSAVAVALVIGWLIFALAYPMLWEPRAMVLAPLPEDHRAYILRMPAEGPLPLIVAEGSYVTLVIETNSGNVATMYESGVKVIGTQCLTGQNTGKDCYAVVAVPSDAMGKLQSATKVSAWLERQ